MSRFVPSTADSAELRATYGDFHFDSSLRKLDYRNKTIELTTSESVTLRCLLENAGTVVSHKDIAQQIWGRPVPDAVKIIRYTSGTCGRRSRTIPTTPSSSPPNPARATYSPKLSKPGDYRAAHQPDSVKPCR